MSYQQLESGSTSVPMTQSRKAADAVVMEQEDGGEAAGGKKVNNIVKNSAKERLRLM